MWITLFVLEPLQVLDSIDGALSLLFVLSACVHIVSRDSCPVQFD